MNHYTSAWSSEGVLRGHTRIPVPAQFRWFGVARELAVKWRTFAETKSTCHVFVKLQCTKAIFQWPITTAAACLALSCNTRQMTLHTQRHAIFTVNQVLSNTLTAILVYIFEVNMGSVVLQFWLLSLFQFPFYLWILVSVLLLVFGHFSVSVSVSDLERGLFSFVLTFPLTLLLQTWTTRVHFQSKPA